ncbi:hypothetical protein B484DRAFT_308910, partial [Ochromonadaceae sp. CCMP2298]
GDDETIAQYLAKWAGQLLKYPHLKTTCPVLLSEEGSGKNTFFEILASLLGRDKVLSVTNSERDLFGTFNSLLEGKLLVLVNEAESKMRKAHVGQLKEYITESHFVCSRKGEHSRTLRSCHRFAIFANSSTPPVDVTVDNRRFTVVSCSNDLKGDATFFDAIYACLEQPDFLKTVYSYLTGLDGLDTFHSE